MTNSSYGATTSITAIVHIRLRPRSCAATWRVSFNLRPEALDVKSVLFQLSPVIRWFLGSAEQRGTGSDQWTYARLSVLTMLVTNRSVKTSCVLGRLHVSRSNIAMTTGRPRLFSSSTYQPHTPVDSRLRPSRPGATPR